MTIAVEELIQTTQQLPQPDQEYIAEYILKSRPAEADKLSVISDKALLGGEPVIRGIMATAL